MTFNMFKKYRFKFCINIFCLQKENHYQKYVNYAELVILIYTPLSDNKNAVKANWTKYDYIYGPIEMKMNFRQCECECVNQGVNELRPCRRAHQDAGQIRRQNKSLKCHKSHSHMQSLSPGEGKCIRIKFYRHFLGHHHIKLTAEATAAASEAPRKSNDVYGPSASRRYICIYTKGISQ